jgi:hypothetical protein
MRMDPTRPPLIRELALILALLLAGSGPVAAQSRIGQSGWEGFTAAGSDGKFERCVLYNRSIEALNDSPYDMLGLTRDVAGHTGMLVFYQPRALTRGTGVTARVRLDQHPPVTLTGDVTSDFHIQLLGQLDAKFVEALRQAKTLEAVTQGQTTKFNLVEPGAVLDALAACVKANETKP